MKIYVVTHFYNNGESYEDYRECEYHYYYSTLKLASALFWEKATSNYEGRYVLSSVELDTQETEYLEETPYIPCSSQWDIDQDYPEPEYYLEYPQEDDYLDPMKSYKDYWRHEDDIWYEDGGISEEEDKALFDYVTTPGTNYQEWEESEKDIIRRKEVMMINSNPNSVKLLDELAELLGIKFEKDNKQ